jgi:hypothetical protein
LPSSGIFSLIASAFVCLTKTQWTDSPADPAQRLLPGDVQ